MAIPVLQDLIVPGGDLRTYVQNLDHSLATALWMGGNGYYEPSLINRGEIHLDNPSGHPGILIYFSSAFLWRNAVVENYGLISAIDIFDVRAVFGPGWSPDLYNAGTISASASRSASAFSTWDLYTHVVNAPSGVIEAVSQEIAIAVRMANGNGVILPEGIYDEPGPLGPGSLTNHGEILARLTSGAPAWRDQQAIAVHLGSGPGDFISILNSGLIEASAPDPTTPNAQAIYMWGDVGGTIVNSGTIRGDYAIREQSDNQWRTYNLAIENSGLIEGRIELTEGNDLLTNSGNIIGNVDLGEDADTLVNRGTVTGEVSLGTGNDIYDGTGGVQNGRILGQDGADLLIGTSGVDTIDGGAGNDILVGGGGDTLTGGSGNDLFAFSNVTAGTTESITDFVVGADLIDFRALAPTSVTISGATVTAITASGALVIQLNVVVSHSDILTNTAPSWVGSSGDDALIAGTVATALHGLGGDDLLIGGSYNDFLDGGSGEDTMWGGPGDDIYVVDVNIDSTTSGDVVVEYVGAGTDTVRSSVDYILPANVEDLVLLGSAPIWGIGNDLTNTITGNSGSNVLRGGDGADYLSGGMGSDTLTGGSGNDAFRGTIADLNGDTIMDFARGDRIVVTDATLGLTVGLVMGPLGNQLTIGSTSLLLSNVRNPSLAIGAAPEGGVQISFGGPTIIFSSAVVDDPTVGAFASQTISSSREIPGQYAERAFLTGDQQFPDALILHTADNLF